MLPGIVVHTPTLENFIDVTEYCEEMLCLKWYYVRNYANKKEIYGGSLSSTCIRIDIMIYIAHYNFYKEYHNMNIISTEEFFSNVGYKKILKDFR